MRRRPKLAWGLLVGIGLVLYACGDGVLTPDGSTDVPFDAVASSSASLSFGDAPGPTTFYCNVVTREADGTFRRKTHRLVLPPRFSTPGLESELRFFEQRYSNGAVRQKAVCDLPVHGFAFAMVQARLHGGNRNRSVEPYDPWQRRLLGLEVASLPERAEIQAASLGFFLTLTSRALQQVFVTNDPLDVDCDGEWAEVEEGMFNDGYDYEGYWYCDGVVALDGMEVQALDDGPSEEDPNWYIWPDFELPDPPPGPSCCGGGPGDPGDPPPDDEECDPELDTCDPCDPTDEICEPDFDLSCDDAVRGDPVTCTITGSTSQITEVEWHFSGSGFSVSRPVGTQMTWSGTAVVGGTVTATVSYDSGTEEEPLTADFSVTPRNWSWNPTSTVLAHASWPFDGGKPLATTDTLGITCWTDGQGGACLQGTTAALQPWAQGNPGGCFGGNAYGFECDDVDQGPNKGLWYITNAFWSLNRRSGIHPEFSASRAFSPLVSCQPGDGPGAWAAYHDTCRGLQGTGFVAGLIAHENGHVAQADAAAAAGLNPVTEVELLVRESESDLNLEVVAKVFSITTPIEDAGRIHPTGNFDPRGVTWSFWDGTFYAILRTFNQVF